MELRSLMEQRMKARAQAKEAAEAEIRWIAIHKKTKNGNPCGEEAFGYAIPKSHDDFKPWIGGIIYKRGHRPYEVTEERIKAGITCSACGTKITDEDQFAVAPEIFTVKSLLRFYEIFHSFAEAQMVLAEKHIRMLEYGAMLGMTYETWKAVQDTHDQHVKHLKATSESFHNLCAILGVCGSEPKEPSKLLRASGATDLREVARATGNTGLSKE
jgi:hypothetical protein